MNQGTNNAEPRTLRAKQVAELYNIGKSTVHLYAKQGIITPIKVSKYVTLFDIDELDRVFKGKKEAQDEKDA